MFCSKCGASVLEAKFCPSCGTPVNSAPQANKSSSVSSETNAAMWCHLGALLAGFASFLVFITAFVTWLPPLLIRQKFPQSEFVQQHARESINFQLQWLILTIPMVIFGFLTLGLGFILILGVAIWLLVLNIQAAVAASRGAAFTYPFVFIRLVK